MSSYTVVWDKDARDELARLWIDNPRLRLENSAAADGIEPLFAVRPLEVGVVTSAHTRQYVEPPLKFLYTVSESDCLVRVLYVKFWED